LLSIAVCLTDAFCVTAVCQRSAFQVFR
jgi:hypothetical protein